MIQTTSAGPNRQRGSASVDTQKSNQTQRDGKSNGTVTFSSRGKTGRETLPSHRSQSLLVKPLMSEPQQTLARSASVSGTSLHTGEKVTLKLQPAPVDSGIRFKRKDLEDEPTIDATIANLKTVERATT